MSDCFLNFVKSKMTNNFDPYSPLCWHKGKTDIFPEYFMVDLLAARSHAEDDLTLV